LISIHRVFSGSTGSNWRSSTRRGPSGRRRNPPPTCPKLLPRPGQSTLGARVRRSSRSVWSGFRPDMSEGAWRPPRAWPVIQPAIAKTVPRARARSRFKAGIRTRSGEGAARSTPNAPPVHAGGFFFARAGTLLGHLQWMPPGDGGGRDRARHHQIRRSLLPRSRSGFTTPTKMSCGGQKLIVAIGTSIHG